MPNPPLHTLANLRPAWQPGQSANTVGARGFRQVLSMARKGSPEAVQIVLQCMRDPGAPWPSRLAAATWIVERAWGKAKETLQLGGADGANILIVTGVPRNDEETVDTTVSTDGTTYTIDLDADDTPCG